LKAHPACRIGRLIHEISCRDHDYLIPLHPWRFKKKHKKYIKNYRDR